MWPRRRSPLALLRNVRNANVTRITFYTHSLSQDVWRGKLVSLTDIFFYRLKSEFAGYNVPPCFKFCDEGKYNEEFLPVLIHSDRSLSRSNLLPQFQIDYFLNSVSLETLRGAFTSLESSAKQTGLKINEKKTSNPNRINNKVNPPVYVQFWRL